MGAKVAGEKVLEMRCLLDEIKGDGTDTPLLTSDEHTFLEKMAILVEECLEIQKDLYPDITQPQANWIDDMYEKYSDYLEDDS